MFDLPYLGKTFYKKFDHLFIFQIQSVLKLGVNLHISAISTLTRQLLCQLLDPPGRFFVKTSFVSICKENSVNYLNNLESFVDGLFSLLLFLAMDLVYNLYL
jgi:hypothetical protein